MRAQRPKAGQSANSQEGDTKSTSTPDAEKEWDTAQLTPAERAVPARTFFAELRASIHSIPMKDWMRSEDPNVDDGEIAAAYLRAIKAGILCDKIGSMSNTEAVLNLEQQSVVRHLLLDLSDQVEQAGEMDIETTQGLLHLATYINSCRG